MTRGMRLSLSRFARFAKNSPSPVHRVPYTLSNWKYFDSNKHRSLFSLKSSVGGRLVPNIGSCDKSAVVTSADAARDISPEMVGSKFGRDPEAVSPDFDKEQFRQIIRVTALKIPAKDCQYYMKTLSNYLLGLPRVKNVIDDPNDSQGRLLLLKQGMEVNNFPQCMLNRRKKNNEPTGIEGKQTCTLESLVQSENLHVTKAAIELDYDHLTASEALRILLPEDIEVPSSFETVGHIVHLNLKEKSLPYRYIVGKVILDKNPRIRTVVNKIGNIENQWRVFDMEIIAGEDNTITEVRQGGLRYKLDFQKVYWNSRLEAEHSRLVRKWFQPRQVIADAMAGIGPFVIPAAKLGCFVLGNDLNPDSYNWLVHNVQLNKVGHAVSASCMDGREFLRSIASGCLNVKPLQENVSEKLVESTQRNRSIGHDHAKAQQGIHSKLNTISSFSSKDIESCQDPKYVNHIVMNLPATAVEFLDALNGTFSKDIWGEKQLPMLHVYAFLKADETTGDLQARIEKALGGNLGKSSISFHPVRDVAPNKQMFCASFQIPKHIAFSQLDPRINPDIDAKRQKIAHDDRSD